MNNKKVYLFALSTCVWCKKTKEFLDKLGIKYDFTNVDLLEEKDKDKVYKELKKWNPDGSFPVVVIDDSDCVIGFNENKIKEYLDK
jgi:glutaredoxin